MVLTKEDRIELLARARLAKANKRLTETPAVVNVEPPVEETPPPKVKKTRSKKEIIALPEPVHVIQEDESDEEEEVEEVIEVPIPVPKKKATPNKFSKLPKIEPQKCCGEKVSYEEPLITDDKPQIVGKNIVIPAKKEIKKPRQPRASTRTLDIITEPKAIEEVMDDVISNDTKYRPLQQRQVQQVKHIPTPSAPISIIHKDPPLQLFHY